MEGKNETRKTKGNTAGRGGKGAEKNARRKIIWNRR
jgi:hypothetical protein